MPARSPNVSEYLRGNVLGLVAIFLAMSGGAYAITGNGNGTTVVQHRVTGTCGPGQSIRAIQRDGDVICTHKKGPGTVTSISTSGGLTGSGTSGDVALGTDPSVLQSRVSGNCTGNNAIQSVAANGTVSCEPTGTGTLTSVDSGFGLTGGPITQTGTLAADPTVLQRRVTGTCSGNNAVQSVAQAGTVGCSPFVTSVTAGSGLNPGTITNSGTISVDPTATQSRVTGSCSGGQAVQGVTQAGGVNCSSASIQAPLVSETGNGTTETLFSVDGISVVNDCSDGTNAKVLLQENAANAGNVLWTNSGTAVGFSLVDGNAAPPGNSATIASTTGLDRGEYNVGQTTGPNGNESVGGTFYVAKVGGGCQVGAFGIGS